MCFQVSHVEEDVGLYFAVEAINNYDIKSKILLVKKKMLKVYYRRTIYIRPCYNVIIYADFTNKYITVAYRSLLATLLIMTDCHAALSFQCLKH